MIFEFRGILFADIFAHTVIQKCKSYLHVRDKGVDMLCEMCTRQFHQSLKLWQQMPQRLAVLEQVLKQGRSFYRDSNEFSRFEIRYTQSDKYKILSGIFLT